MSKLRLDNKLEEPQRNRPRPNNPRRAIWPENIHLPSACHKASAENLVPATEELCEGGMILKREGVYMLNGMKITENRSTAYFKKSLSIQYDKKIRAGILLALLIVSTPIAAQVLASLFMASPPVEPKPEPVVIGNFKMILEIHDVSNLYAWQVNIAYDKAQVKVTAIDAGDFPDTTVPGIYNYTNSEKGYVLVGDSLIGSSPGWSGSCRLAAITFGYYVEPYAIPEIVPTIPGKSSTALVSAALNSIPIMWGSTLTLAVENP